MSEEIEDIDFKDKNENKSDDDETIIDDTDLDILENSDEEENEDDGQEDDEQEDDEQEDEDEGQQEDEEEVIQEDDEEYYEDGIEEYEKDDYSNLNDNYKTNDITGDSDSDNSDDEQDLDNEIKFTNQYKEEYIKNIHPNLINYSNIEIYNNLDILKSYDESCGITKINDDNHRTLPYLTKYEKSKILGQRAIQINEGCVPFVDVEDDITDGYTIALKELEEKKIPFIIKRPLPNGKCEFWRLEDLEQI